ncbi:MAG: branched-chain amino acid ABC transporter permease [Haloplanus sp.]
MVSVSQIGFLIVNGVALGMVLLFIAAGLSLIFGLMGVVNFAHGALFGLGAYIGLTIFDAQLPFLLALLVAPFIVAGIGVVLEVLTIRPLYDRDPIYQILLTFGLSLILDEFLILIWGPNSQSFGTPGWLTGALQFAGVIVPNYRAFVVVVGTLMAAAIYVFLERTDLGMIVRAGTMDSEMVQTLGINVRRSFTIMFAIGTGLAAFGGVMSAPILGVYPGLSTEIILDAFVVVVIGGLGSFRGAIVGALFVGLAQMFGQYFVPQFAPFIIFAVMAATLLAKPEGLFGAEITTGVEH